MTSRVKLIFPFGGLLVALFLIVAITGSKKEAPTSLPEGEAPTVQQFPSVEDVEKVTVPATAGVTGVTNVLLQLADLENQTVVQDASADASFVNFETSQISDFGQSVNGSF